SIAFSTLIVTSVWPMSTPFGFAFNVLSATVRILILPFLPCIFPRSAPNATAHESLVFKPCNHSAASRVAHSADAQPQLEQTVLQVRRPLAHQMGDGRAVGRAVPLG